MKKISELRESKEELDPDEDGELIEQIDAVLEKYRRDTLQLGATGQLVLLNQITEVRPSEKLEVYEAANPINDDGSVVLDQEAIKRRRDAIVKMLTANKCSLIILGGGHDLADNLPPNTEYLRVMTSYYAELQGE